MSKVEVKIEGLRELERELRILPDNIGQKCLRGAMRDGGNLFKRDLQSRVKRVTGKLASALAVNWKYKNGVASAQVGALAQSGRGHILRFLELGTGAHLLGRSAGAMALRAQRGKVRKGMAGYGILRWVVKSSRSARFAASGGGIEPRLWIDKTWKAQRDAALKLITDRLAMYIGKYKPSQTAAPSYWTGYTSVRDEGGGLKWVKRKE